jgi:hypothetical protein
MISRIKKKNYINLQNVRPGRVDGWGWWAGEIVSLHHRGGRSVSALFDTFPRRTNWRYLLCS